MAHNGLQSFTISHEPRKSHSGFLYLVSQKPLVYFIYPNAHKKGAWGTVKLEGTIPDTAGSNGIMGPEVLKRIAILPNLCDNTLRSFGSIC